MYDKITGWSTLALAVTWLGLELATRWDRPSSRNYFRLERWRDIARSFFFAMLCMVYWTGASAFMWLTKKAPLQYQHALDLLFNIFVSLCALIYTLRFMGKDERQWASPRTHKSLDHDTHSMVSTETQYREEQKGLSTEINMTDIMAFICGVIIFFSGIYSVGIDKIGWASIGSMTAIMVIFLILSVLSHIFQQTTIEIRGIQMSIRIFWIWEWCGVVENVDLHGVSHVSYEDWENDKMPLIFRSHFFKGKARRLHGKRGIRIEMKNGAWLFVGSDAPEKLAEAIRHKIGEV